jgi:hypothetical protein
VNDYPPPKGRLVINMPPFGKGLYNVTKFGKENKWSYYL